MVSCVVQYALTGPCCAARPLHRLCFAQGARASSHGILCGCPARRPESDRRWRFGCGVVGLVSMGFISVMIRAWSSQPFGLSLLSGWGWSGCRLTTPNHGMPNVTCREKLRDPLPALLPLGHCLFAAIAAGVRPGGLLAVLALQGDLLVFRQLTLLALLCNLVAQAGFAKGVGGFS